MRISGYLFVGAYLWIHGASSSGTSGSDPSLKEEQYCHYEKFNPVCKPGEMIVIHSALYGRMAIGRCVKTNFGFVGCSTDVLNVLDRTCSGRRACAMDVVDPSFGATVPCNDEFKNYLEVSYSCVEVPKFDVSTCSLTLDEAQAQVVPGGSLHTSPCGTITRPLRVQVRSGQRINMTLLDFSQSRGTGTNPGDNPNQPTIPELIDMPPVCIRYGLVYDGDVDEGDPHFRSEGRDICKAAVRESLVLTSSSRVLLIQFYERASNFALRFTVVGCPHLVPPKNAYVEQDSDQAKVGCRNTKRVWHVVCQGNVWVGDIGNCTQTAGGDRTPKSGGQSFTFFSLSSAWTSLVALGVAIIIGLVILVVGLFCWRRYLLRRKERKPRCQTMENTPMYQIASSQNIDSSDVELDLLAEQQRTPCVYCRAANEHYAPFSNVDKATILPRQSIYSGTRTLERPVMPPDLYSCNVKNTDNDERIKIMSDLNVAYDRLPQTLPMRKPSIGSTINTSKAKDRDQRVLSDI